MLCIPGTFMLINMRAQLENGAATCCDQHCNVKLYLLYPLHSYNKVCVRKVYYLVGVGGWLCLKALQIGRAMFLDKEKQSQNAKCITNKEEQ